MSVAANPASKNFEDGLQAYVTMARGLADDDRDVIVHVLAMPTKGVLGIRRKLILGRMERRARTELGLGPTEAIDWSTINWGEIFAALIQFVMKFLLGM